MCIIRPGGQTLNNRTITDLTIIIVLISSQSLCNQFHCILSFDLCRLHIVGGTDADPGLPRIQYDFIEGSAMEVQVTLSTPAPCFSANPAVSNAFRSVTAPVEAIPVPDASAEPSFLVTTQLTP